MFNAYSRMGNTSITLSSDSEDSDFEYVERVIDIIRDEKESGDGMHTAGLTTDAAADLYEVSYPSPEIVFTLNTLEDIFKQLDHYEVVSLVYLLYNNAALALHELELHLMGKQKNLLFSWAQGKESTGEQWQIKLLEAMCLIQNYNLLKKFNYKKDILIGHFLPHIASAALSINKLKKAIFSVCEKMDGIKMERILGNVKKDFEKRSLVFRNFENVYFELYFLYWQSIGYISSSDISNIVKMYKISEVDDLYEILLETAPCLVQETQKRNTNNDNNNIVVNEISIYEVVKPTKYCNRTVDNYLVSEIPSYDAASNLSSLSQDNSGLCPRDEEKYNIDPKNPGVCLIINQHEFYPEFESRYKDLLASHADNLESRAGTEKDRDRLKDTFQRYKFKIVQKDNLTHVEMIDAIKETVDNITVESSLIVCILSHGDQDIVYGVNSCKVYVKKIQDIMCKRNKKHLAGKPKILILQACQGTDLLKCTSEEDEDLTTDGGTRSVPDTADMMTFYATVPGYAAIRHKSSGSWFIQSLCDKIISIGHNRHFEDICMQIIRDVSSKSWKKKKEEVKMVPIKMTTLRYAFYLPAVNLIE